MAGELFEQIGVAVDTEALCADLSIAQQQCVEIAKALSLDARIIVMDEPSATLTPAEVERLFNVIRDLRSQGIGLNGCEVVEAFPRCGREPSLPGRTGRRPTPMRTGRRTVPRSEPGDSAQPL